MSTPPLTAPFDPLAVLKGLAALRRLTGTYPPGHPMIGQKLKEIGDVTDAHLQHTEVGPGQLDILTERRLAMSHLRQD